MKNCALIIVNNNTKYDTIINNNIMESKYYHTNLYPHYLYKIRCVKTDYITYT